jgi:capsule polysaccharide export protein KpsC/LpsZ
MRRFYTPLADAGPFVYYPLHVPGDMALTLRSGEYLDQLALVDYLARTVPATHRVAVKEHPAMIGALDAARLRALLRTHDNVVVLPPETNNYEVLRATDVVVSVNSKSGAEAALLGKRVLVLGDAFYSDAPIVERVESLSALRRRLAEAVADPAAVAGADVVSRYFELVWQKSKPGELYGCNDENFRRFADSLIGAISVPVPAGD